MSNLLRQSSSRLVRSKSLPLCSFIMLNKTMLNLLDINVSAMPLWTRELLRISQMERWPWIKLGSRETYLWKQKRKKTEKGLRFSVGPTTPIMHCTSPDQLCAVWIIGETRKCCRVEIIGGLNTVDKSKDCVDKKLLPKSSFIQSLYHFLCLFLSLESWKQLSRCCLNPLSDKMQIVVVHVAPTFPQEAHEHTKVGKTCSQLEEMGN